jgi:hypothetical protein
MSVSLEEAIGLMDISEAEEHKANELPWFDELPPAAKKKAQGEPFKRFQKPKEEK